MATSATNSPEPLLLALLGLAAAGPAAAAPGLCTDSETVFLACQVADPKVPPGEARWVSLCGHPPQALQYRFGRPGRIELQYPQDPAAGMDQFGFAHYKRLGTDRVEIRFVNRGTEVVLFDYQEDKAPRETGVRTTRKGGKEQEVACTGPVTSRLHDLKAVLRCDAENGLNLGRCP
jgi:hypothetical protein